MIAALKRAYGSFRGFDLTGSAVPPMEGPLKPNTALDSAPIALTLASADNLVPFGESLVCSSGTELVTLEPRAGPGAAALELAVTARQSFPAEITCLASDGREALAIGLDNRGIIIRGGQHDGVTIAKVGESQLLCPTASLFLDPDRLLLANGSADTSAGDWKRDLMSSGHSGSLWLVDLAERQGSAKPERIADKLAFPTGIAPDGKGGFFVSEAWRHRVLSVGRNGTELRQVLGELPAYPGRLIPAASGGFWLALFAPRNPLVEFVLLETAYRRRMMETIEPDYWIAPALSSGKSFLEPIQGGARKKLNRLKPWSPSWSYGLVARCDHAMRPMAGAHSRADGQVHGVTSLCEWDGSLLVAAKGSGVVVVLAPHDMSGGSA